jgi:predicted dehydrogenase
LYGDFRELLTAQKPDIVIVATPDHWHPLIAIAAMQAGAHVYVEKPIGHTINEGKAMVRVARQTGKVCQVGTHRRVSPHNVSGMDFLKSGKAGKIGMVRAFVSYGGGAGQKTADTEPPKDLNWDMWCGPAPMQHYNTTIHPRGFRNYLNYANGTLGDWGIHWLDQILWWTEEKAPRKVYSTGGRAIRRDNTDAPDHQVATYEFEDFTAIWEHRQFAGNNAEKTHPQQAVGCYFYGTEGTFHMGWVDGWTFYPTDSKKPTIHQDPQLDKPDDQNIMALWVDFLDAIRKNRLPVCDIETGHRSTNMALLGMLSMKLGRSVAWNGDTQTIANDPEANALLSRAYRGEWQYPV